MVSFTTKYEVIVPAEITPRRVGLYLRTRSDGDTRLISFAPCCSEDFTGQPNTAAGGTQIYVCTCGKQKLLIRKPHRCGYLDVPNTYANEWVEEWTGMKNVEVEVK